ncbi:MAG: toll/interleukin-1 receptor domain-containing protein [Clostridiales bacterium]|nr:toll/interleukin-1 receptor domain-containing protein [Clostridiales bacterium]
MRNYRVFISYSHKDIDYVLKISAILEQNGLTPVWDRSFSFGYGFHEQIENYIAHAHVFIPVITAESNKRGWVHQEIGYAKALHVPIIPISIGELPGEMISQLHAITLDETLKGAEHFLTYKAIDNLVQHSYHPSLSTYCCTEQAEERAELIVRLADEIISLDQYATIRQRGGLSSFQIPSVPITDPRWARRYNNGVQNNDFHCRRQLEERRVLETHARAAGCRLVVNPDLIVQNYVKAARVERLETFLEFIESMPDDKIDIAFDAGLDFNETVTLVGDWFSSEAFSRTTTSGFRQAIFTRHAPGIRRKIDAFDEEFGYLLQKNGVKAGESRTAAIEKIKSLSEM